MDCDLEVVFANINDIAGVTKDTVFVVTYSAKLTEAAVIGNAGNPNTVTLEYSNNPYDENSTGETSDNVVVYTYKLVINKVDAEGAPLAGAGFTLYKHNGTDYVVVSEIAASDATVFTWTGLDDGQYKLEESTVPAGYNKMDDIEFTVEAVHDLDGIDTLTAGTMTATAATGVITDDIVNNTGTVLPETGGAGTMWLIFGGAVLVMLAGVFMITRKKMSVYED